MSFEVESEITQWNTDNPAGRLHTLLTELSAYDRHTTISAAWADLLGVPETEILLALADVRRLPDELRAALDGEPVHLAQFDRHSGKWIKAIFSPELALTNPLSNILPPDDGLEVLAGIAVYLSRVRPEGPVPDEDALKARKQEVLDLIEAVEKTDDDLPPNVKRILVERLREVIEAIDHLKVGGPNAVKKATEALAGALVAEIAHMPHEKREKVQTVAARLMATASVIWFAFTAPAIAQDSLSFWEEILQLPAPASHEAHRQPDANSPDGDTETITVTRRTVTVNLDPASHPTAEQDRRAGGQQ